MSKLVRDKIPEIIKESGKEPIFYKVDSPELEKLLREKLVEEVTELLSAITSEDVLEESADVYEVLLAILFSKGYDVKSLVTKADDKRNERGAFTRGYVLERVE